MDQKKGSIPQGQFQSECCAACTLEMLQKDVNDSSIIKIMGKKCNVLGKCCWALQDIGFCEAK
jgi:hypothetical protein